MIFHSYDEPPNAVDQYASELLVARAWPEKPQKPSTLATGQGRTAAENGDAGRIIVACLAVLVLLGLGKAGWEIGAAVLGGWLR